MAQGTAYDVVKNCHRDWTSGNIEEAMSYVSDDISRVRILS